MKALILEEAERPDGMRIATVRTPRGDEYLVHIDAAVVALATLFSDHDNEQRQGWSLETAWYAHELANIRSKALVHVEGKKP